MKKMLKTITAVVLIVAMACCFAGCGEEEATSITVGGLLTEYSEKNATSWETQQGRIAQFNEVCPDMEFIPDSWKFDVQNYLAKAAAGDLPNMFGAVPTELKTLVESGYVADISKYYEKYGYDEMFTDQYENLYTVDGKYYAIPKPSGVYSMGIVYNLDLFEQAGLMGEDGLPKYPQTWEEFAQTAQTITEKTGKAGFAIATKDNIGGWHFINIAYAFGVDFMEHKDGKWVATFASDEGVAALQFVKDLKWKYNCVQTEILASHLDAARLLSTNEAAMVISQSQILDTMVDLYDLDKGNVAMSKMPAGPAGRFSQMSGDIYVFSKDSTPEQIEACFEWLKITGISDALTEAQIASKQKTYTAKNELKQFVGLPVSKIWKSEERIKLEEEIMAPYVNVDPKRFEDYVNGEGVTYALEPERCTQQLYSALDAAIQEVLMDENADCAAIMQRVQNEFQTNYLDHEV